MIDQATAQRIKDAADIVEVVSDYVHLVRRGQNFMGLCPFHNERTPSFSVNRKRNFCYCFSCKKGGSPVNFIMEKEGLSYKEALMHLAKKYGIEVQERELTDEERAQQSEREGMLVANEWAMRQMESDLRETEEGRDIGLQYFTQRGVTDEAIRAFHLGYAIDNGHHLVDAARAKGFDLEVFKNLGLIGTSQQDRLYDRFRGRVIFPILNNSGKVIAFGGRDLKGGLAKYINSPESPVYKKSNELYGIFQARQSIVRENKCFLVEGYMDVIGMWQAGMKNVVASSGTALTDGQIALLHRLTDNITLIYDGDAAGIKASLRGIDMLLSHKLNVKVLLLPDGDDPDSFALKHTPDEFSKYVEQHETDIIRFKIQVLLNEETARDPQKRIQAVNSVVASIAHIPDPIGRDVYIQECARLLNVSEESIARSVGDARRLLTDKWKRERDRRSIDTIPPGRSADASFNSTASPVPSSQQQSPAPAGGSGISTGSATSFADATSFRPLELPIIKYCLRYGYKPVFQAIDENDPTLITVLEYVEQELDDDNMSFAVPEYAAVFVELKKSYPLFLNALSQRKTALQQEYKERMDAGIAEIAKGDHTMSEITMLETKLKDTTDTWFRDSVNEFIMEWPGQYLASHEDDTIRRTVTALLREKHHLSHIYSAIPDSEKTENRLDYLVPRAITEWKGEILNRNLADLLRTFREKAGSMDMEEEKKLQRQINALMKLRQRIAKETGDRTLLPR